MLAVAVVGEEVSGACDSARCDRECYFGLTSH